VVHVLSVIVSVWRGNASLPSQGVPHVTKDTSSMLWPPAHHAPPTVSHAPHHPCVPCVIVITM
jgi:hypothetical protein